MPVTPTVAYPRTAPSPASSRSVAANARDHRNTAKISSLTTR